MTPDIDDIIEEYIKKSRTGDAPGIDDFVRQYPEHTAELKELLPLLADMEGLNAPRRGPAIVDALPDFGEAGLTILRQLGRGGMGIVYEAEQVALNRRVAVKTLPDVGGSPERQRQFEVEARAIARLYHPGIVQIYSAGRCAGVSYYVMELVRGTRLDAASVTGLRRIAEIGLQAADALGYAHRCGILHRDVKPSNMLLDEAGNLRLMDFGLAEIIGTGDGDAFRGGTLRYMAPERLEAGVCTAASDQYALGIVLYELVTGAILFRETSSRLLAQRICASRIPPLPCASRDFAAIVEKCLRKDPAARYASLDEMAADLRNFLDGKPVQALPPSPVRRLAMWISRNPALAASGFTALAASLALVAALLLGYVRTRSALDRARRNAENAEASLRQVFDFVESRPPSKSTTKLLVLLLPYFQEAVSQKGTSNETLYGAWHVIGSHARRVGDRILAEKAARMLLRLNEGPEPMNDLTDILRDTGRAPEADALQAQVVVRYAESPKPEERFQAFLAMCRLAEAADDKARLRQAFEYLLALLTKEPGNSRLRFSYAQMLSRHPGQFHAKAIPGLEPNALRILAELSRREPDNVEYAIAYVRRVRRMLRAKDAFDENEVFTEALETADRLLSAFSYVPEAVSEAIAYRKSYSELLRRAQRMTDARREQMRLLSLLRSHYFSEDAPDELREALLDIQFRQLRMGLSNGEAVQRLQDEIRKELEVYHGKRAAEFRERLKAPATPEPAKKQPEPVDYSRK